ncbi:MAG: valine--tRNA ligase [Candidatus Falkowbacteria bacterium]
MSKKELPKIYNPADYEDAIYAKWEKSGFFNPDNLKGKPYSIMMPPPNVTGVLHLGHALENSLMDIMARYQRMNGKKVLLLPGTDHAAVATQAKVEKNLIEQGIKNPRQELGREKLLEKIREYAENSKATIIKQIKKMGTSCHWDRLAYTFDETRSKAVNEIFIKMYNDGLIRQDYRAVNWTVKGQSTCSDDELVYVERPAKLYTFKYAKDFPIPIATTRPETKLGDTAVAVHPKGKWKKYIGKTFTVDVGAIKPLEIKIIADEAVDASFGTGAVGVTPAHSMVDFEMYEKQKLKGEPIGLIQVIDQNGKMMEAAGKEYAGLSVLEAREKFVVWLKKHKKQKLFIKEEDITQNVGTSDRFGDAVEVLPMTQWFVDVNKTIPGKDKSLKELMREAVTVGHNNDSKQKVKITPERFEKVYLNWIDNLRDWCISRQIWWGHRIPVWYNLNDTDGRVFFKRDQFFLPNEKIIQLETGNNGPIGYRSEMILFISFRKLLSLKKDKNYNWNEIESAIENININSCNNIRSVVKVQQECPGEDWIQDQDTLDTWFSSGLWTFSTLGWPEKSKDLKMFHPTSWMQMGYEILFFWMARMILMSTYALDQIPFKDVYIHGILRNELGKKFSKSSGNNVDPLEVAAKYGMDALRLSLISGITPGNDSRFYEEKVEGARNMVNKLWNIARYILQTAENSKQTTEINFKNLTSADKWILSHFNTLMDKNVTSVTKYLELYEFSLAGGLLREFTWGFFADWYLEATKFQKGTETEKVLLYVLRNLLKLWHPFMPFVTEAIWKEFNDSDLIIEKWPEYNEKEAVKLWEGAGGFEILHNIIIKIRNARIENGVDISKKVTAAIIPGNFEALIDYNQELIKGLRTGIKKIIFEENGEKYKDEISIRISNIANDINDNIEIYLIGAIDKDKERVRLEKEIANLEKIIKAAEDRLANKEFVDKAPVEIVKKEKEKLKGWKTELKSLKSR